MGHTWQLKKQTKKLVSPVDSRICSTLLPSLSRDPGVTVGPPRSTPWNPISQQILPTTANLLELSTCNCALCLLDPDSSPLQVQWVTQLSSGALHILCSVMGCSKWGPPCHSHGSSPMLSEGPSKRGHVPTHAWHWPQPKKQTQPLQCTRSWPRDDPAARGLVSFILSCSLLFGPRLPSSEQLHPEVPQGACPQDLPSGHAVWATVLLCTMGACRGREGHLLPNLKMVVEIIYQFPLCLPTNLEI